MKKLVLLAAVAALFVGMLAGPAAAHPDTADVGTFNGTADVGKSHTGCNADGTDTISGGGLGVPVLTGPKSGFYQLSTRVSAVVHGGGDLDVCGQLEPVAGVGAACGMSQGTNGKGRIVLDDTSVITLTGVVWPATAGGTLPVTGNYSGDHGSGTMVAEVQAQGADACAGKTSPTKADGQGATRFIVAGVAEFVAAP